MLIGIAVKGEAVAGVVYQPYYNYQAGPDAVLGRAIWGIIGLGQYGVYGIVSQLKVHLECSSKFYDN